MSYVYDHNSHLSLGRMDGGASKKKTSRKQRKSKSKKSKTSRRQSRAKISSRRK